MPKKNDISIIEKSFNKSYHTYQLNFTYPELRNSRNQKHIALNLEVQGFMVEAISSFQERLGMIKDENSFSYLNFDYTVCSNFKDAMSIRFLKRSYHPGMGEAQELNRTLNFDKKSGKIIHLSQLFLPDVNYQEALINIINKKFSTCKVPNNMTIKSFCLSKDHLLIVLNKQNLPDNFCSNDVEIEWSQLQGLLNPDYIAYELANQD